MTTVELASIVEGHGEERAVPVLIRRIAAIHAPEVRVTAPPSWRRPASRLLKPGQLEGAVEQLARGLPRAGGILVLLDCDDDVPCRLGPQLLERARSARPDIPVGLVLAVREFEGWFLAAAESLQGRRGLPRDLQPPADPEAIRDAKGWLGSRMATHKYAEAADQAALAAVFDIEAARRAYSFDKCYREVARLLDELRGRQDPPSPLAGEGDGG